MSAVKPPSGPKGPTKIERCCSGWKTFLFNSLVGFSVIALQISDYLDKFPWPDVLPPKEAGWVALALGIINILLRHWTVGPAGWRKGSEQ